MQICVYCGKENPETRDHVPPKGLFAPGSPNLITVPCCTECHRVTTKDDEYFRRQLAMRRDTHDHPDVQGVLPKVLRGLGKPNQSGFTKALINSLRPKEIKTPAGLIVGNAVTYEVDKFRLGRVVERIVRGLFWKQHGKVFPFGGNVSIYMLEGMEEHLARQFGRYLNLLQDVEESVIGNDTLRIRVVVGEEEYVEVWWLLFYGKVEFLAFLIPK